MTLLEGTGVKQYQTCDMVSAYASTTLWRVKFGAQALCDEIAVIQNGAAMGWALQETNTPHIKYQS